MKAKDLLEQVKEERESELTEFVKAELRESLDILESAKKTYELAKKTYELAKEKHEELLSKDISDFKESALDDKYVY